MTTSNPFTTRIATAARQGYIGSGPRNRHGRTPAVVSAGRISAPAPRMDYQEISVSQLEYVTALLAGRDLAAEIRPKFRSRMEVLAADKVAVRRLTRSEASALIDCLKALPMKIIALSKYDAVPAGHYALISDGAVCFLRVDRPITGRHAGKLFVALQHGDEYTTMNRQAGFTMLDRILDLGVALCSAMYGRHIGKCGVCHRTLTNEASRAAGIGPICQEKNGW